MSRTLSDSLLPRTFDNRFAIVHLNSTGACIFDWSAHVFSALCLFWEDVEFVAFDKILCWLFLDLSPPLLIVSSRFWSTCESSSAAVKLWQFSEALSWLKLVSGRSIKSSVISVFCDMSLSPSKTARDIGIPSFISSSSYSTGSLLLEMRGGLTSKCRASWCVSGELGRFCSTLGTNWWRYTFWFT